MKKARKVLTVMLAFAMALNFIVPVSAQTIDYVQNVESDVVKVGYTQVYMDSKPSQVPSSTLRVEIKGEGITGKNYETSLLTKSGEEVVSISGTLSSDEGFVELSIPGTTTYGEYEVKTLIDGVEKSNNVVLTNNVNLTSSYSTNITGYTGGIWDLVDGVHWSIYTPIANKPTAENPAEFVFEYADQVEVYSVVLSSTCGDAQGPKTGEILYWDNTTQEWINILNNGNKTFDFNWVTGANCELLTYDFDSAYSTNKIMLRVTDGNTSWDNTNNIVEVQVWGAVIPEDTGVSFNQTIDDTLIEVGYTQVYNEDKPSTVPSSYVNVEIDGTGLVGKNYKTVLLDGSNNEILENTGTCTSSKMNIKVEVPSTTTDGKYTIQTTVGNFSDEDEIIVLNNVNINSSISTNTSGYTGYTWDLVDGLQWGMYTPKSNKPTSDSPAEFVFDYGCLMDIYTVGVASTYGNDQGPKTGEILYWDLNQEKWINVYKDGNKTFNFNWVTNGVSELLTFDFDDSYSTNKIMLRVTDSNTSWDNTNSVVEVQAWGYKVGDVPKLSIESDEGIYKENNKVTVVVENTSKLNDTNVTFELVDALSHQSLSDPIVYTSTMTNGKLEYEFIVPSSVDLGTYVIKVSYDDYVDYTKEYRIVLDQDVNVEDVSKYLNIALEDDYSTKITTINDDDMSTIWKKDGSHTLLLEVKPENNRFANVVLKNIKVYAKKDSITSATLRYVANTNYYRYIDVNSNGMLNVLANEVVPEWKSDSNGDYFVIDPQFLTFGNIFTLELGTNDKVEIEEIEVNGIHISENLFAEAKVTHDGNVIDAYDMTDNIVSSYYKTNSSGAQEYVFDFSPRTITTNEIIYVAHYPSSQGVAKMKVEIWENGTWKEIGIYDFSHKTDNEIREAQQVVFEEITTEKIKLTAVETNRRWDNSYLFSDIMALGTINENAQYIADTLDTSLVPNQGETILRLPEVEGYTISVNSSTDEDVISLDAAIKAKTTDTKVTVTLKVVNDSDSTDIGVTKEIEVEVPRLTLSGNELVVFEYDDNTIINNPAMGWLQYYEYTDKSVEKYWQDMDALYEKGLKTNILYIRNLWSWFEPEEGQYAWEDPNSQLSQLVNGARERGLQLAFRVVVDSRDMWQQAVPQYVYDAGALGYVSEDCEDEDALDPYINDTVFLEKFEKFIKAFAEEYNDNLDVAYIDGWGFGDWGEGHGVKYHTSFADNNKTILENIMLSIDKIINIYEENFPDVLLGTMEGQPERIGNENTGFINNTEYYTTTFEDDYDWVIRKDTFGWMTQEIRDHLLDYFEKGIPTYAENCYHSFQKREYWYANAGWPTLDSILTQVVSDALYVRANTLDARTVMDCESWLLNDEENYEAGQGLLDLFGVNGGYRLAPTTIEVPTSVIAGDEVTITSAWRNYGVGILPNNNKHWNQKYKVAYALLDSTTNEVVYQYNATSDEINPGDWLLEDGNNRYDTVFNLPSNLAAGKYKLSVAIVNEKNEYIPEIELAVDNATITDDGWYVLNEVNVVNERSVTFDSNGGTTVESQKVNYNECAKVPSVPKKEGYVFAGWYKGTEKYDFNTPITDDIVLVASWVVKHTVTFVDGDLRTEVIVTENQKVEKPTDPVKEGYKFIGWFVGEEEFDFDTVIKEDMTIIAKWEKVIGDTNIEKPVTGDTSPVIFYTSLSCIALISIIYFGRKKRFLTK